jgi:hypothetical protein
MKEKNFKLIHKRKSLVPMKSGATATKLTLLTLMAVFVESANHRKFKSLKTNGNVLSALWSTKSTGIVTV